MTRGVGRLVLALVLAFWLTWPVAACAVPAAQPLARSGDCPGVDADAVHCRDD
jgi:hypothetical protein